MLGGNIGVAQHNGGKSRYARDRHQHFQHGELARCRGKRPIDPVLEASGSTVVPILRANNIDLQWPSIEDLDRLPHRAAFTLAELSSLRLAKLADAFQERAPLDAEALDAISHSHDGLDDPAVIAEEYDRLTDSWLIARLKRDQPAIAAHERLIKAARLWKQYLRDPRPLRDSGLIADFLNARVILPRSLTTSRPSCDTGADSGGKSSIDADRTRYAKLVQELAVRESIQKKAYRLYWDKVARSSADRNAQDTPAARPADDRSLAVATIRANRSPSPPALDSGFFRQLDDRLTNNEKTKLQELSGGELLAGKRLDDLLGDVLDVKDVIVEANSICARIRVFESEQGDVAPASDGADAGSGATIRPGDRLGRPDRRARATGRLSGTGNRSY